MKTDEVVILSIRGFKEKIRDEKSKFEKHIANAKQEHAVTEQFNKQVSDLENFGDVQYFNCPDSFLDRPIPNMFFLTEYSYNDCWTFRPHDERGLLIPSTNFIVYRGLKHYVEIPNEDIRSITLTSQRFQKLSYAISISLIAIIFYFGLYRWSIVALIFLGTIVCPILYYYHFKKLIDIEYRDGDRIRHAYFMAGGKSGFGSSFSATNNLFKKLQAQYGKQQGQTLSELTRE